MLNFPESCTPSCGLRLLTTSHHPMSDAHFLKNRIQITLCLERDDIGGRGKIPGPCAFHTSCLSSLLCRYPEPFESGGCEGTERGVESYYGHDVGFEAGRERTCKVSDVKAHEGLTTWV